MSAASCSRNLELDGGGETVGLQAGLGGAATMQRKVQVGREVWVRTWVWIAEAMQSSISSGQGTRAVVRSDRRRTQSEFVALGSGLCQTSDGVVVEQQRWWMQKTVVPGGSETVMVWYNGQAATRQRVGSATGFRRMAGVELQQQQIVARL
ncbi:hypothetical protein D8674_030094 [Pyrus ussuriensis x Pyrus communis]|uniref:Uncharacterized protein n=1 Tax=Pyrus ussuriensis x Pyrus communis TaxID=2448454 RepID=A0A5N5F7M1_9ROSA|nr:hypothetical protein D8674_030094 [Pyrus ussuriensis x Pyrus communis]